MDASNTRDPYWMKLLFGRAFFFLITGAVVALVIIYAPIQNGSTGDGFATKSDDELCDLDSPDEQWDCIESPPDADWASSGPPLPTSKPVMVCRQPSVTTPPPAKIDFLETRIHEIPLGMADRGWNLSHLYDVLESWDFRFLDVPEETVRIAYLAAPGEAPPSKVIYADFSISEFAQTPGYTVQTAEQLKTGLLSESTYSQGDWYVCDGGVYIIAFLEEDALNVFLLHEPTSSLNARRGPEFPKALRGRLSEWSKTWKDEDFKPLKSAEIAASSAANLKAE